MKMTITRKLLVLIIAFALFVMTSFSTVLYFVMKAKISESAGLELVGCAEITKKLFPGQTIQAVKDGDKDALEEARQNIDWIVDEKPIFKDAFLIDPTGHILAGDKQIRAEGVVQGDTYPMAAVILETIKKPSDHAGHDAHYTQIYTWNEQERMAGYAPIYEGETLIAVMVIEFDATIVHERTLDGVIPALQISLLFPIIGAVIAYALIRRGVKPLLIMKEEVQKVAEGDLSFVTTEFYSKDEIGELSQSFKKMVDELATLIGEVNETGHELAKSSSLLYEGSKFSSKTNQEISKELQQVAKGSEDQLFQTKESAAAMDEISSQVLQIAKNSEVMKHSTSRTASSVQEMAEAIEKVSSSSEYATKLASEVQTDAINGRNHVERSKKEMDQISSVIHEAAQEMEHLGKSSEEIGSIIEVIDGIAEQTNLLALNAAIEAARAGEHGKGFSVVADEVKNLAERSAEATKEITKLIKGIQQKTQTAVEAISAGNERAIEGNRLAESASEAIQKMVNSVEIISKELSQIHVSTNMQADKSNAIVQEVSMLEEQVSQVAKATQEQTIGVNEITKSIAKIAEISQDTTQQLHHIAENSKKGSEAIETISANAPEELDHLAHQLQESVGKFKLKKEAE